MGMLKSKLDDVRELLETTDMSIKDIAEECGVSIEWVNSILRDIREQENWADNDDADGDFDSAMASAGFGTGEDYGSAAEEF